jgi:DMSO reductase family type II enzyme chaperone
MKAESFLHYEGNRGDSYKLLAACYYLPKEDIIATLAELEEALNTVCAEGAAHVATIQEELEIEQLRVDYSRLFVGPFKLLAPPYGSVYLEGERRVIGDSTIEARNRYTEVGLNVSSDLKEAPDHIAIELEFMYFLIFKQIESIERSDFESAMGSLRKQQSFLEDHLGAWVPEFADNVEENADTDFYKNLARVTRVFVQKDLQDISEVSIVELSALVAAG